MQQGNNGSRFGLEVRPAVDEGVDHHCPECLTVVPRDLASLVRERGNRVVALFARDALQLSSQPASHVQDVADVGDEFPLFVAYCPVFFHTASQGVGAVDSIVEGAR